MIETNEYSFANALLAPGEHVVHRCKPGEGHLFTAQDAFMIPFGIFWLGFSLFWEYNAIKIGGFPAIFGIPFVLIGLYLLGGRFFHTAWQRKRTAYVITNKRILRSRNGKIDTLDASNLPPMQLQTFSDGSGTILFVYSGSSYSGGRYRHRTETVFSLENVPDVLKVQRHIAAME